ncbi:hypothetical protein LINPERHAP2_LOCUS32194 [Linum perenne]
MAIFERNRLMNNLPILVFVVLLLSSEVSSTISSDHSTGSIQNATPIPFVSKQPTIGGRKIIVERMTEIDTDDYPPARVKRPTPCC